MDELILENLTRQPTLLQKHKLDRRGKNWVSPDEIGQS